MIYYAGFIPLRSVEEVLNMKEEEEKELVKDLDDEEGYYNAILNDQLAYRYEILRILGKGSFA